MNYWIHGAHLQMEGRKMAKSAGNILRISDLAEMGHDPLAFRFLCLTARYRAPLQFSMDVFEAAERGLNDIRKKASRLARAAAITSEGARQLQGRFERALADDLDLPTVGALVQEVLRADIADGEKRALLEDWDRVLAVDITRPPEELTAEVPAEAAVLARERDGARREKDWARADSLRQQLEERGWAVEDTPDGSRLKPRR